AVVRRSARGRDRRRPRVDARPRAKRGGAGLRSPRGGRDRERAAGRRDARPHSHPRGGGRVHRADPHRARPRPRRDGAPGESRARRLAGRAVAARGRRARVPLRQLELVDALDRERRMMNAILRHSPVGVMLEDAAGRIVYANPEIEAIYSLQASDMPGRKPDEIYAAAGAVPAEDGEVDGTLELRMKEPDRTVHVRRVVIPGLEGEPAGVLTLHEDVTVQRQALEAKDLMLRAIGHEVRSPAAAMKNTLAGIMQWDETIDSTGRRTLLQEAYESSDRLLSLVESQLIIAKLETRHFEPTPEPLELEGALTGVLAVLNHR